MKSWQNLSGLLGWDSQTVGLSGSFVSVSLWLLVYGRDVNVSVKGFSVCAMPSFFERNDEDEIKDIEQNTKYSFYTNVFAFIYFRFIGSSGVSKL